MPATPLDIRSLTWSLSLTETVKQGGGDYGRCSASVSQSQDVVRRVSGDQFDLSHVRCSSRNVRHRVDFNAGSSRGRGCRSRLGRGYRATAGDDDGDVRYSCTGTTSCCKDLLTGGCQSESRVGITFRTLQDDCVLQLKAKQQAIQVNNVCLSWMTNSYDINIAQMLTRAWEPRPTPTPGPKTTILSLRTTNEPRTTAKEIFLLVGTGRNMDDSSVACKYVHVRPVDSVRAAVAHQGQDLGLKAKPPSSSIWPHLSYGLVRSKREYYHNCSLVVLLCSFL